MARPRSTSEGRLQWRAVDGEPALFLGLDGEVAAFLRAAARQCRRSTAAPISSCWPARRRRRADLRRRAQPRQLAPPPRHCSVCGQPTEPNRGGWSRACPTCGAEHYPRADPVVIMLAEHDGRLLLGRQPQYPASAIRRWPGSSSRARRSSLRSRASLRRRPASTVATSRYVVQPAVALPLDADDRRHRTATTMR